MSNNETVVPLSKRGEREKTAFKLPEDVRDVLKECQDRVFEAIAIARLYEQHIAQGGDAEAGLVHHSTDRAIDAIIRLLTPVVGIDDHHWLDLRAKQFAMAKNLNESLDGAP